MISNFPLDSLIFQPIQKPKGDCDQNTNDNFTVVYNDCNQFKSRKPKAKSQKAIGFVVREGRTGLDIIRYPDPVFYAWDVG